MFIGRGVWCTREESTTNTNYSSRVNSGPTLQQTEKHMCKQHHQENLKHRGHTRNNASSPADVRGPSVVRLLSRVHSLVICDIQRERNASVQQARNRMFQVVCQHRVLPPSLKFSPVKRHWKGVTNRQPLCRQLSSIRCATASKLQYSTRLSFCHSGQAQHRLDQLKSHREITLNRITCAYPPDTGVSGRPPPWQARDYVDTTCWCRE